MTNPKQQITEDVAAVEHVADQQDTRNRLRELALERLDLKTEIDERQDRIKQIDEILLQHPVEINHVLPGYSFRVTERRTLDKAALAAAYPKTAYPQLYRLELNQAAVKAEFSPAALAEFQKVGTPYLTVKETK